jgi:hypothetical protein
VQVGISGNERSRLTVWIWLHGFRDLENLFECVNFNDGKGKQNYIVFRGFGGVKSLLTR